MVPATATTSRRKGIGPLGVPRRWVIYRSLAEASSVPPKWHGWLHYLVDTPPTEEEYAPRAWEKPHRMNMTGTREAYRPAGSILGLGPAAQSHGRLQALASAIVAVIPAERQRKRESSPGPDLGVCRWNSLLVASLGGSDDFRLRSCHACATFPLHAVANNSRGQWDLTSAWRAGEIGASQALPGYRSSAARVRWRSSSFSPCQLQLSASRTRWRCSPRSTR